MRSQDVDTVSPDECTRSFQYMKDIWKQAAKQHKYEGGDFVKVLPEIPSDIAHRSAAIYGKLLEMGGPTQPMFDQRQMHVVVDKIAMRKRSGSDELGSKPKRGRPANETKMSGPTEMFDMFQQFMRMQTMMLGNGAERPERHAIGQGTGPAVLEIFSKPRPSEPRPTEGTASAAGEAAPPVAPPVADVAPPAPVGSGESSAAVPAKRTVDQAAADLLAAMGLKGAVKAQCKAKAKKADAAGVPPSAAIPPKGEGPHFKGLGCACDEATRKQVTCRFGKGPGSTKAIRYGPGTGLTSKQALVKGEAWLQEKRRERDRALKACKKE